MRIRTLLLLFFITSVTAIGQSEDVIGKWTNGLYFFWSSTYSDSIIVFAGGTVHEGGYTFTLKIEEDNKFTVIGSLPGEAWPPSLGEVGDKVSLFKFNSQQALIITNTSGSIKELLRKMDNDELLDDLIVRNMTDYQLAGKYVNPPSPIVIEFLPDIKTVTGLSEEEEYTFATEYDFPIEVLVFPSGKAIEYEKTKKGLDIYDALKNEYDDWEKQDQIYSLTKIEWNVPKHSQHLNGKFPFASAIILTDDILGFFNKDDLRIMRNEIFARYGYRFKTTEMSNYFNSQNWYEGHFDDVNDNLTDLEKLNIRLIQQYEKH